MIFSKCRLLLDDIRGNLMYIVASVEANLLQARAGSSGLMRNLTLVSANIQIPDSLLEALRRWDSTASVAPKVFAQKV